MISNISQLQNYLLTSIPKDFKKKYTENWGLDNVKKFLEFIDNPQEKQPTIHVSGTSGKGSTSYFTAKLLEKQGFKVGLHVSPYVIDFRESFLIDNQLPAEKEILECFNSFVAYYEKFGIKLTYHELKTCFAYYFFNQQKVNFVVIETGMGGTFDSTNTVSNPNKICLINQIGYDHQEFLGSKISQIADEESGIINPDNTVVFIQQQFQTATKIITKKANQNQAKLYQVTMSSAESFDSDVTLAKTNDDMEVAATKNLGNNNYKIYLSNITTTQNGTTFDYKFEDYNYPNLTTYNLGDYQAKNAALGLTGLTLASQLHNFKLDQKAIYAGINEAIFPARMQILKVKNLFVNNGSDSKIIIDGAHNDQKITALVDNLKHIFPDNKFTILCGFSGSRDPQPMLKKLIEIADKIIVTQFTNQGMKIVGKDAIANPALESSLKKLKFKNYLLFEKLEDSLDYLKNNISEIGLVTGSFYLCGEVLKNFID